MMASTTTLSPGEVSTISAAARAASVAPANSDCVNRIYKENPESNLVQENSKQSEQPLEDCTAK
jgi:hypothetical protein